LAFFRGKKGELVSVLVALKEDEEFSVRIREYRMSDVEG